MIMKTLFILITTCFAGILNYSGMETVDNLDNCRGELSVEKNRNFKSWIEPNGKEVFKTKTWPCREQGIWWDTDGVKDTQLPKENCKGINTSYSKTLNDAQFRPDHKNRNTNDSDWVFSNYLQIGSGLSILP